MNSLKLIALDNFPLIEPNDNLINLWYLGLFTIEFKYIFKCGCIQKLFTCCE